MPKLQYEVEILGHEKLGRALDKIAAAAKRADADLSRAGKAVGDAHITVSLKRVQPLTMWQRFKRWMRGGS